MSRIDVGVIGGSGLYAMEQVKVVDEILVDTPFGAPSDPIVLGEVAGVRVGFLPRHGKGHRLSPTGVPYAANIYALKTLGAKAVVSVSAVGSLREEIAPGHVVVPDQLIDRTKGIRRASYFDEQVIAHVAFGDPYCASCRDIVAAGARELGLDLHAAGTLVVMEGPAFSTRAESNLYRSWGADIIGMTALPEAKLAREAQLCYVTLAMATDYDCWHESEEDVTVDAVVATLKRNSANAERLLVRVLGQIAARGSCSCHHALDTAVITSLDTVPADVRHQYAVLLGKIGELDEVGEVGA